MVSPVVGEGEGGATVGLGVTGTSDGVGVGAIVGDGSVADGVGDDKLGVGEPKTGAVGLGFGLAAGVPHAATRTKIRSAAAG
jgi:hypothetical protein